MIIENLKSGNQTWFSVWKQTEQGFVCFLFFEVVINNLERDF